MRSRAIHRARLSACYEATVRNELRGYEAGASVLVDDDLLLYPLTCWPRIC